MLPNYSLVDDIACFRNVERIFADAIAKIRHLWRLSSLRKAMEIRFPRNHFRVIVSAEMVFPLFRTRSRVAETSTKKFALVTHTKLMWDASQRFHAQQSYFIALLHTFTIEMIEMHSQLYFTIILLFYYLMSKLYFFHFKSFT